MKMTLTTIALTLGLTLVGCNDDAYDDTLYDDQSDVVLDDNADYDTTTDYDTGLTDPTEDRYEAAKPMMEEPTGSSAEVTGDTDDLFADPAGESSDPEPGIALETDAVDADATEDSTQTPATNSDNADDNPPVIKEVE